MLEKHGYLQPRGLLAGLDCNPALLFYESLAEVLVQQDKYDKYHPNLRRMQLTILSVTRIMD